jgi:uncharacterized protein YjbJ (UPF0337 family)
MSSGLFRKNGSIFAPERGRRQLRFSTSLKEDQMNREHVRNAADKANMSGKAKGAIKETAGKVSGDKELESEGKVDKAKGDVHKAAGNVKDAARNLTK